MVSYIKKKFISEMMGIINLRKLLFEENVWLLIGLFFSLLNADIDTNSILVILGSSGLAIALSLQNTLSQVINGLIILYFNYYELDDIIKVGDYIGKVVGFTLLNTTIQT